MSAMTVLILCLLAGMVGFLAAVVCYAASSEFTIDEVWEQGREFGKAEIRGDRDRAVTVVEHPSQVGFTPRPFDWAEQPHGYGWEDVVAADEGDVEQRIARWHAHGGFQP